MGSDIRGWNEEEEAAMLRPRENHERSKYKDPETKVVNFVQKGSCGGS